MAEFYVLPEHRTGGIGTRAFHKLLETCPGAWEVSVMKGNRAGMAFWSKAIAASVSKDVERLELADEVVYRLKTLGIHV
ncbi:hypothetical protein [Pseudomonas putida]|uniref:hypothetical protein n=1 Tax=Pseudomonas putida TaxID=303 RepID=UPI00357103FE